MDAEIVLWPDDRLHTECTPVDVIDDDVKNTAKLMAKMMYEYDGCGIAAPQIGDTRQIVVIDCDWGDGEQKNPIFLINPVIVEASDQKTMSTEGCLSVPGISVEVERSTSVVVHARDLEGRLMRYEASNNLFCVCLQHEIDHLHGYTMIERLSPTKRIDAIRRYKEALKDGAQPGDTE